MALAFAQIQEIWRNPYVSSWGICPPNFIPIAAAVSGISYNEKKVYRQKNKKTKTSNEI